MNKFLNWLFGFKSKPETEEEQAKRIAEINEAYNDLQKTNAELAKVNKELAEVKKQIAKYGEG
jgi:formiminotetrahydrofolate cyclodeaminase